MIMQRMPAMTIRAPRITNLPRDAALGRSSIRPRNRSSDPPWDPPVDVCIAIASSLLRLRPRSDRLEAVAGYNRKDDYGHPSGKGLVLRFLFRSSRDPTFHRYGTDRERSPAQAKGPRCDEGLRR